MTRRLSKPCLIIYNHYSIIGYILYTFEIPTTLIKLKGAWIFTPYVCPLEIGDKFIYLDSRVLVLAWLMKST